MANTGRNHQDGAVTAERPDRAFPGQQPAHGPGAGRSASQEPGPGAPEDPMAEAVESAEAIADRTGGLGHLGKPMNRRSPFFIGAVGAAGVAVTVAVIEAIGGAAVTLVALTVSLPVAIATLAFMIVYKLAEDYLIVPRVMGRTVQVPATVTLVAVLVGGALLGIIGALVAIPLAAAVRLLLEQTAFPRLDRS